MEEGPGFDSPNIIYLKKVRLHFKIVLLYITRLCYVQNMTGFVIYGISKYLSFLSRSANEISWLVRFILFMKFLWIVFFISNVSFRRFIFSYLIYECKVISLEGGLPAHGLPVPPWKQPGCVPKWQNSGMYFIHFLKMPSFFK